MPLYRIGPQANKYQGIDTGFYAEQLSAKQSRADANKAAWSQMMQDNANVARLDEESYQQQMRVQREMWEDMLEKNKGNMALATDDVLRGVETAKQSPYWNLNARHVKETAEREKLLSEYGSEAIDRSQGLDGTPLYDEESGGFRSPSGIKSDVVKANAYGTSVETMLADTSPHIKEAMSELGVAPGTPEYYKAVKTYTESLSRDEIYDIVSQPEVQRAFLANNPTSQFDNRQYGNTGLTYQEMFSTPEGISDFMYGNVQDKYKDTQKTSNSYKENKRYTSAMTEARQKRVAGHKQGLADESAAKIRKLEQADPGFFGKGQATKVDSNRYSIVKENLDKTGVELNQVFLDKTDTEGELFNLALNNGLINISDGTSYSPVQLIDMISKSDLSDDVKSRAALAAVDLKDLTDREFQLQADNDMYENVIGSVNDKAYKNYKKGLGDTKFNEILETKNMTEEEFKELLFSTEKQDKTSSSFSPTVGFSVTASTNYDKDISNFNDVKEDVLKTDGGFNISGEPTTITYTNKNSPGYQKNAIIKADMDRDPYKASSRLKNMYGTLDKRVVSYEGENTNVSELLKQGFELVPTESTKGHQYMQLVKDNDVIALGNYRYAPDDPNTQASLTEHNLKRMSNMLGYSVYSKAQKDEMEDIKMDLAFGMGNDGDLILAQTNAVKSAIESGATAKTTIKIPGFEWNVNVIEGRPVMMIPKPDGFGFTPVPINKNAVDAHILTIVGQDKYNGLDTKFGIEHYNLPGTKSSTSKQYNRLGASAYNDTDEQ